MPADKASSHEAPEYAKSLEQFLKKLPRRSDVVAPTIDPAHQPAQKQASAHTRADKLKHYGASLATGLNGPVKG